MARSNDGFLTRESEDVNLDGEIWGLELNQSDGGKKVYGIAGADGQAEKARKQAEEERAAAEAARATAETARSAAEQARASAEAARAESQEANDLAQAKNNADQAANNAAAQGLVAVIVDDYDPETMMPNGEGQNGKMYLVPLPEARAVAESVPVSFILRSLPDGTYAAERVDARGLAGGGDVYVEWLWINGSWERIGLSTATIDPITTEQIDAVVAGENPQGKQVLNLTGLSYLFAKLKAAFAALKHTHKQSEVEGLTGDLQTVRDSLSQKLNYRHSVSDFNVVASSVCTFITAQKPCNAPSETDHYYICMQYRLNDNYASQMALPIGSSSVFTRGMRDGAWSAWRKI